MLGTTTMMAMLMLQQPAGPSVPTPTGAGGAEARAVAGTTLPVLDGRLDDPAWREAVPIRGFVQRDPDEGAAASEPTEVRVVHGAGALYVAIRAWDRRPDLISSSLARRDEPVAADWVGFMIDSRLDRRTAYEFAVNAAGVQRDLYRFNDGEEDPSWNAVWEVATAIDSAGWTAEFRIPFSQFRLSENTGGRVGFNAWRQIPRLNELQYWQPPPRNSEAVVSLFGDLLGFEDARPRTPLEVTPYLVQGAAWRSASLASALHPGQSAHTAVGGDLRLGVTRDLVLTGAINPDFGQVEADPSEVNLSANESFFREQRPFFTEGVDLFQFSLHARRGVGSEQLFYSRRIGRQPQVPPDARGGEAAALAPTRILAAGKLTGRSAGGWSIGLLGAVTAAAEATVVDSTGRRHVDLVEPGTGYGVLRMGRDLRGGQTTLGAFATRVERADHPRTRILHQRATVVGADLFHRFRNDTYSIRAWIASSVVAGSAAAMARTQQGPVHYFQRPDQEFVAFDSTRTSLSGTGGVIHVAKHGGGNWLWSATTTFRTPGLEVNDLGFQSDAATRRVEAELAHRWLTPGRVFRSAELRLLQAGLWTWDGERIQQHVGVHSSFTLANYWRGWGRILHRVGGISTQALRGLGALRVPGNLFAVGSLSSDPNRAVRVGLTAEHWRFYGDPQRGVWMSGSLAWRPSARQELVIEPTYSRYHEPVQLLGHGPVHGEPAIVVGSLKSSSLALTTRATYVVRPNLSVQFYAQPFIATGRSTAIRRVVDSHATTYDGRFAPYAPDQILDDGSALALDVDRDGNADLTLRRPDYRVLALNSNLIVRWEYLPGSSLFLVWQHGRTEARRPGGADLLEGLQDLFGAGAENRLILKASYWMGLR